MKHLIFKGKPLTGKSLFSRIIFNNEQTCWIDARTFRKESFPFDVTYNEKWEYENIVIDDPGKDFNLEEFYTLIFSDNLIIDRKNRERIAVKTPRFIFLLDSEIIDLPEKTPSFNRRFHVVDFDKDPISEVTKIIHQEKIIIKTAQ